MSVVSDDLDMLLEAAVTARAATVMKATDGSGKLIEAQFIAVAKPGEPGAMWARPAIRHKETAKRWATSRACVSLGFMAGRVGAGAEAVVAKYIVDYWLTETVAVCAVLLEKPTKIWAEQREHPRYLLRNDGGGIRATLRRQNRDPAVKEEIPEAKAMLWDLGLGGAGFFCPFSRSILATAPQAAFSVTLEFDGRSAVLPARCTYARAQGNLVRMGMQFEEAIAAPEAMLLLTQAVAELEKREARYAPGKAKK